ncbi:unnamed protein product [Angiostrongylus costaricensis]|uniref:Astacin domain-containing protein n=1 Tax=Angiostrongylus costaricensis TaxID=334426 RepID=A0A0R3PDC9_ANGCS|nr:unnamed protein product [Angiostrongylus costaricensis]
MMLEFIRQSKRTNYNYNLTYDYGSVFQNGTRALGNFYSSSKNGWPTIIASDADYSQTFGSGSVSFYDKLMMNLHYACLCEKNPISTFYLQLHISNSPL